MATKINTARVISAGAMVLAPPPLESGDRLRRAEFERRYEAMPWVKKAELIEGVAYMGSPVRQKSHSKPHSLIITWLGTYTEDGVVHSRVFPGLCLNIPALLKGDLADVLATLQSALKHEAHAAFVARLAGKDA